MEFLFIAFFFLGVFLLGFLRAVRIRTKAENVFYVLCMGGCLLVLLLKCFDIALPDPSAFLSDFSG